MKAFEQDPPAPDGRAAAVRAVEAAVRRREVPRAVLALQGVGPGPVPELTRALDGLERGGYGDAVALLRLCVAHDEIPRLLRWSRAVGRFVGAALMAITALLLGSILALVPGLAAWYLAGEIARVMWFRSVLRDLAPEDRRLVHGLLDASAYGAEQTTVTPLGGWLFAALGVGLAVIAGIGLANGTGWLGIVVVLTSVAIAASGVLSARGATRLRRSGLFQPAAGSTGARPFDGVAPADLDPPVVIRWPRPVPAGMVVLGLVVIAGFGLFSRNGAGIIAGISAAVVAAVLLRRLLRAVVTVDGSGIQDVGVLRTRRYEWTDVVRARAVGAQAGAAGATLRIVDADGRARDLVLPLDRRPTSVLRLAAAIDERARADEPGPDPGDIRFLSVCIAFAAVVALFAGALLAAVTLAGGSATVDPATVPAGQAYWRSVGANGQVSAPFVTCPSPASWITGDRDPLCGSQAATGFRAILVILVVEAAVVTALVLLWRRRHRMAVERRSAQARRPRPAAGP